MAKEKLCVVLADGRIPELGNILGPITVPTKISKDKIISMMNRGLPVYEVNPRNTNERVRLSFSNINSVLFIQKVRNTVPVKTNPYKLPDGKRNNVVEETSEVSKVNAEKNGKKNKNENITAINKSDF